MDKEKRNEINKSLKPCPMCGSRASLENAYGEYEDEYRIGCDYCEVETISKLEKDMDELVEAWNLRCGEKQTKKGIRQFVEGTRVEYRPWEDCSQKDRVKGTVTSTQPDEEGYYMVKMDWQRGDGHIDRRLHWSYIYEIL